MDETPSRPPVATHWPGDFPSALDPGRFWQSASTRVLLGGLLLFSLAAMLAHYYFLIGPRGYTLVQAVNTVHQLSPAGVLYSVFASLFLLVRFSQPLPLRLEQILSVAGRYSYSIFWLHPFFLHYLHEAVRSLGWRLDATVTAVLYLATLSASLATAVVWQKIRSKQK